MIQRSRLALMVLTDGRVLDEAVMTSELVFGRVSFTFTGIKRKIYYVEVIDKKELGWVCLTGL